MRDTAEHGFQDSIRSRLKNGFSHWNNNYDAWLEWCDTLYEPDAFYNLYDRHLSLQKYKEMMGLFFKEYEIVLGDFNSLLVQDDWCAIRYKVFLTNRETGEQTDQNMMEFIHFKDKSLAIGLRAIEGWVYSDKPLSSME